MSRVDGQWIRIDSHAVILTDGSHPPNLRQPSTSSRMDPIREVIDTIGTATDGSHPRDLRQPSTSSRMDTIRETFGKCEWTSFEKSAGFLLSACSGCVPSSWCSACDLPAYDVPSTLASPSNRSWTTLDSVAPLLLSCWIASPKLSRGESIREAIERHGCIPSARGGTSRVEEGRVGWGYGGRFINILIHQLFFGFGSADRHYVSIPHPEEMRGVGWSVGDGGKGNEHEEENRNEQENGRGNGNEEGDGNEREREWRRGESTNENGGDTERGGGGRGCANETQNDAMTEGLTSPHVTSNPHPHPPLPVWASQLRARRPRVWGMEWLEEEEEEEEEEGERERGGGREEEGRKEGTRKKDREGREGEAWKVCPVTCPRNLSIRRLVATVSLGSCKVGIFVKFDDSEKLDLAYGGAGSGFTNETR
ncbi:hypothetical protein BDN71DRAFT_1545033 [Pleurotus eryngii]|uniref:Uncharacterized protein n=1 Tax=Pleurotus eryngii TaxID=5323 RepID=A0A9P5ZKT7_PLEER|nr:hypothetical protein BDN71DRAFT_1545033 [Pleurotus eryngii]